MFEHIKQSDMKLHKTAPPPSTPHLTRVKQKQCYLQLLTKVSCPFWFDNCDLFCGSFQSCWVKAKETLPPYKMMWKMMFFGEWLKSTRKKELWVSPIGFGSTTFRLRYHWALGDSWQAKPFNYIHGNKLPANCKDRNVDIWCFCAMMM